MNSTAHKTTISLLETAPFPPSILQVTQNDDLLISILSLLPTKSVIRFKSVSKRFLSLLSHPCFSLLHVSLSPPSPPSAVLFPHPNNNSLIHSLSLHLPTNCTSTPSTSLNFTNDPTGEIEIVQSCKGLLLCSSGASWDDGIDRRVFYVYNPTTKKFSTIHPPETRTGLLSISIFTKVSLIFDPRKSPYFKILLVRKVCGKANFFQLDIYCSKMRNWRRSGEDIEWPCFEVFSNGVYWNGAVYWASKPNRFLCFEIDNESFIKIPPLPDFRNTNNTTRYFGESGGCLYIVDSQGFEFDIFEMGMNYSNWVPKFQIDLGQTFDSYPCMFLRSRGELLIDETRISLISVVREGGDEGDLCLFFHVPGKILSYNLKSGEIKMIYERFVGNVERAIPALVRSFRGYQHFDTLACV